MTPLIFRADPKPLKARETAQLVKQAELPNGEWKALSWPLECFATPTEIVELSEDGTLGAARHYLIKTDTSVEQVEYRTGYVEELAARLGLMLSRDTADDYVRLYMGLTRGQGGQVVPIEQVDQLPLREELTLITRRKLQASLTPLSVQDAQRVTGCFLIGDKLFSARADIGKKGGVTLEPLALIADTLPVIDSALEA